MYSQDSEDDVILHHIKNKNGGVILDIGANDGITYSNSRMFIEKYDWKAVLIEPTKKCVNILNELYSSDSNVEIFPYAIDKNEGNVEIFTGNIGKEGSINQVSTIHTHEKEYWESKEVVYDSEIINTIPLSKILEQTKHIYFDIVSIDTEGSDCEVLEQVFECGLLPEFIIFEHNSNKPVLNRLDVILANRYETIASNSINSVLKRK
jgi:FkbM family methyltransferase